MKERLTFIRTHYDECVAEFEERKHMIEAGEEGSPTLHDRRDETATAAMMNEGQLPESAD